jgi:hypothetical protein
MNQQGTVCHTTIQTIHIKSLANEHHQECAELYVTALGDHDIIFGTDWLKAHNPEVDWATPRLVFTHCPPSYTLSCYPLVLQLCQRTTASAVINSLEPINENKPLDKEFLDHETLSQIHCQEKECTVVIRSKSTISTELAAKHVPRPSTSHIPEQYQQYSKVFSKEASHCLPQHQPWNHAIELIPGTTMKNCEIYRLTPKEENALKEYIMDHLCKGYIRPSKSPMASPFFFVDKKDGKQCPVQDYRALNDITIKNMAPIPLIPDLIDKLCGARYFTKLDVRWGYNNICIREGDEYKAAFKTALRLFEPLVMTFGLCNAPTTFQTFMNNLFSDLINDSHVIVYLDDILIFQDNPWALQDLTHDVLCRLQLNDLYLKPEKCSFHRTSIEYLGVVITAGTIKMDPEKVSGILKWPTPCTLKNVQAFLGFCNFYRRLIKDYSTIACPLFDLMLKNTPFLWNAPQDSAFHTHPCLYNSSCTRPPGPQSPFSPHYGHQ